MSALVHARKDWRWGNGSLALLFACSLVLFSAWRWHPGAWLRAGIDGLARQAGIGLRYRSLHLSGLALRLDGVDVALPGLASPVALDRLILRPAWPGLLSGHAGGRISARWRGQVLRFSVEVHGRMAMIHVPDTRVAISVFRPLWQRMLPLSLGGDVELHGDAGLALPGGRPVQGRVEVAWRHASAGTAGHRYALGSFRMRGRGEHGRWRFGVSGGDQARLTASGSLNASGPDARAWGVRAQGRLAARTGSALAAMMGDRPVRFVLSRPVASPHWPIR